MPPLTWAGPYARSAETGRNYALPGTRVSNDCRIPRGRRTEFFSVKPIATGDKSKKGSKKPRVWDVWPGTSLHA